MKSYLLVVLLLIIVAGAIGFFIYNKPHQNIQRADADFEVTAQELFSEFETNEKEANSKYLDKIVEVSGTVLESAKDEEGNVKITLDAGSMMFGVICQLDELSDHEKTDFEPGEEVTFKGICTGMLMDVVIVRCVVV